MSKRRQSAICLYCKSLIILPKAKQFYCSDACRFWDKVEKGGHDECWNWLASTRGRGYGSFRYKGHLINAHRFAWFLTHGPIPKQSSYHGICALHKCDNPACCNPAHLFLGTNADNKKDSVNKNRHAKGENHGRSKLTENQVIKIKHEVVKGTLQRIIAKKSGITCGTITDINIGRSWSHV